MARPRHNAPRTTVAISKQTKAKLDKCRAPGQCYDGFISQMADLWEELHYKKENALAEQVHKGGEQANLAGTLSKGNNKRR